MSDKSSSMLVKHALSLHSSIASLLSRRAQLSPTDVHRLRVVVKELQALWQCLKPLLTNGQSDSASRGIGRAARLLADVREQTVLRETLEGVINESAAEELSSLHQVRRQMSATSASSQDAMMTTDIADLFAQDLTRWQTIEVDCNGCGLGGQGYRRLYCNARKCFRRAVASDKTEDWHRLRRWTKYLALVTPVIAKESDARALTKRYSELAENLGDLHDLELLTAELKLLPDQNSPQTSSAIELMQKRTTLIKRKCYKKSRRLFCARKRSKQVKSVVM